jgi:hypothetical protein
MSSRASVIPPEVTEFQFGLLFFFEAKGIMRLVNRHGVAPFRF